MQVIISICIDRDNQSGKAFEAYVSKIVLKEKEIEKLLLFLPWYLKRWTLESDGVESLEAVKQSRELMKAWFNQSKDAVSKLATTFGTRFSIFFDKEDLEVLAFTKMLFEEEIKNPYQALRKEVDCEKIQKQISDEYEGNAEFKKLIIQKSADVTDKQMQARNKKDKRSSRPEAKRERTSASPKKVVSELKKNKNIEYCKEDAVLMTGLSLLGYPLEIAIFDLRAEPLQYAVDKFGGRNFEYKSFKSFLGFVQPVISTRGVASFQEIQFQSSNFSSYGRALHSLTLPQIGLVAAPAETKEFETSLGGTSETLQRTMLESAENYRTFIMVVSKAAFTSGEGGPCSEGCLPSLGQSIMEMFKNIPSPVFSGTAEAGAWLEYYAKLVVTNHRALSNAMQFSDTRKRKQPSSMSTFSSTTPSPQAGSTLSIPLPRSGQGSPLVAMPASSVASSNVSPYTGSPLPSDMSEVSSRRVGLNHWEWQLPLSSSTDSSPNSSPPVLSSTTERDPDSTTGSDFHV